MIFDKLARLWKQNQRPPGLSISIGTVTERIGKSKKTIRGYGPYTRVESHGARWKKCKDKCRIVPSREPNPHFVISGMSGFGKSTLFKSMILDIIGAGVSCIVLDAHDEHEDLVAGAGGSIYDSRSGGINLLSLDGASVAERIADLSSLFKRVYHLGYIQSTKLSECLWYTYRRCGARGRSDRRLERDPKVGDLLYEIGVFIGNARGVAEKNSLMHLKDKISNLNMSSFNKNATDVKNLRSGLHSFSLSAIKSKEGRLIYIEELLSRIYMVMKDDPKDGQIRQYIMVDEAQFLMNDSEESSGIITKFIEEGRKYGRGVVVVTHSSCRLNKQIVANASTFISFYSREPGEAAFVAKVMGVGSETEFAVRSRLSRLGKNEAILISSNERNPRVASTSELYQRTVQNAVTQRREKLEIASRPIEKSAFEKEAQIGQERINELLREGTLEEFENFVMLKRSNLSIEHEVMVGKIYELLKQGGISAFVYDRANGPDLVAYGKEGKIAIEYETGSKKLEESVAMIEKRLGDYAKVIVVVNDRCLATYRQALGGRCQIISAANYDNLMVKNILGVFASEEIS